MLSARRQDYFPSTPDEILIGAIVPPRVYVVSMPAAAKIKMMAPCAKQFKDAEAKATRMLEQTQRSETKEEKQVDEFDHSREQADEAMRRCFATRAKSDPAFARLTRQAQEIVDGLAVK